ncbi:acylphosphatase-2 [Drosophila pseudoobscura]|uniref:acylphosphatase n=1 Tax=Drosophila pseudoobscura pseudoobscura TaxID=46245 RepID=A0A6I8V6B8_DROPS|nr:acylphosphatase-2 [Drosophila pseudoobscura]
MSSKETQTDPKRSKKIAEEEPKSTKNVTTQTTLEVKPKPAQPAAQLIQKILDCQFEIFGIVQGVSFRMYTMRRAEKLGVRGWCMNTPRNTFTGQIQGYEPAFEAMRLWLEHTGSPTSRIDKCIFGTTNILQEFTFDSFTIRNE